MPGWFWKTLAGLWTAACLGWVGVVFVSTPAWDTSEPSYGIPNGLGIFLMILGMTFCAWLVGVGIIWVVGSTTERIQRTARQRRKRPRWSAYYK